MQQLISRHWVSSKTFEPISEMKIIYWFMCIDTATHCIYIFSLFLILFVNFQKKWHWNRTCEIRRMNMWWQRRENNCRTLVLMKEFPINVPDNFYWHNCAFRNNYHVKYSYIHINIYTIRKSHSVKRITYIHTYT